MLLAVWLVPSVRISGRNAKASLYIQFIVTCLTTPGVSHDEVSGYKSVVSKSGDS